MEISDKIKFDLYIDAVGDGATRSRSIITLLMTTTLVAGLGLFNSLRSTHNWFGSRINMYRNTYPWIKFDASKNDSVFIPEIIYNPNGSTEKLVLVENCFTPEILYKIIQSKSSKYKLSINPYAPFITTTNVSFPAQYIQNRVILYYLLNEDDINQLFPALEYTKFTSRDEFNAILAAYDRAKIENSILIKMPVIGVSFDVNWLGFVSSISFSMILFILYYSISRERKNLFLIFKVAEANGIKRIDFYQMLSMRQVLNVPQSIDQYFLLGETEQTIQKSKIRTFINQMGRYPLYMPFIVWFLILCHDISTFKTGLAINSDLTRISMIFSLFFGSVMTALIYLSWNEWSKIIKIWEEQAHKIKNELLLQV